jgi:hypothetical protein
MGLGEKGRGGRKGKGTVSRVRGKYCTVKTNPKFNLVMAGISWPTGGKGRNCCFFQFRKEEGNVVRELSQKLEGGQVLRLGGHAMEQGSTVL